MNAEDILNRFEKHARRYLNLLERNTCIEQTRILVEVMKRFGVKAEPMGAKLLVVCKEHDFQFFTGGDANDLKNAERVSKRIIHRRHYNRVDGGSHVVALVERRWWVDLTVAQAANTEFDFALTPGMLAIDLEAPLPEDEYPHIKGESISDNGVPFTIEWIAVAERNWEGTPAWEPSHLWSLIARIEADMMGAR